MLGHSLFCISQGGISITEQPGAKTTSWLPVRISSSTTIHQPSQARGLPGAREKRLPYEQQPPVQQGKKSLGRQCWTVQGSQPPCVTQEHNTVTVKINYAIKTQHKQKDVGTGRALECKRRIRSPTDHTYSLQTIYIPTCNQTASQLRPEVLEH